MMVLKIKMALSASLFVSSVLLAQTADAKPGYPAGQPQIYGGAISCFACHSSSPETENNANTTYGLLFGNAYDDDRGTLAAAYIALEPLDIDRDGFSNGQELRQITGYFSSPSITPRLTTPDMTSTASHQAKAVDGGAVSEFTVTGSSFANDITIFGKSSTTAPATGTTTTFMYKFGGMQTGATATFYNENNDVIASTPTNTADAGFLTNFILNDTTTLDGSMNITVKDEGVFDLYSQSAFIRTAKARTPTTFTPLTTPNTLGANISPYAQISPTATVDTYAVIDAYAIVDNYASVGPYAQIGSYAYLAPNVSVNGTATLTKAIIDPYVSVAANITTAGTTALPSGVGYVQAKFSITTLSPRIPTISGSDGLGDRDGGSDGKTTGLHCMTSDLGLQGLMFLGLFGVGFMIRRKRN
ncbi:MAG: hypothetical protein R8M14_00505 [Ghiorsea sp.]